MGTKRGVSDDAGGASGQSPGTSVAGAGAGEIGASASAGAIGSAAGLLSASPLSGPASVSAVWSYFDKDATGNSVCKFCARVIKGHHSSNLLSHLRTAGRSDPAHQQAHNACEEHRESKRAVKKQKSVTPEDLVAAYPQLAAALAAGASPVLAATLKSVASGAAAAPALAFPPFQYHHHTTTPAVAPAVPSPAAKAQQSYHAAYSGVQASAAALSHDQITQDLGTRCLDRRSARIASLVMVSYWAS